MSKSYVESIGFLRVYLIIFLLSTPLGIAKASFCKATHYKYSKINFVLLNHKSLMKTLKYRITGEAPLLMHRPTLANPLDPLSKEYKKYSGKRKKTDEDHEILLKMQWTAGLYYDEINGYHIPSEVIEGCLLNGAKKFKLGTAFKSCLVHEPSKLIFEHNDLVPEDLYQLSEYVDTRMVVVNRSRVLGCRPIFNYWKLDFVIHIDESIFNDDDIDKIVDAAGKYVGICDYRPRYGRFSSKKLG